MLLSSTVLDVAFLFQNFSSEKLRKLVKFLSWHTTVVKIKDVLFGLLKESEEEEDKDEEGSSGDDEDDESDNEEAMEDSDGEQV